MKVYILILLLMVTIGFPLQAQKEGHGGGEEALNSSSFIITGGTIEQRATIEKALQHGLRQWLSTVSDGLISREDYRDGRYSLTKAVVTITKERRTRYNEELKHEEPLYAWIDTLTPNLLTITYVSDLMFDVIEADTLEDKIAKLSKLLTHETVHKIHPELTEAEVDSFEEIISLPPLGEAVPQPPSATDYRPYSDRENTEDERALSRAIRSGDVLEVKQLLNEGDINVNSYDEWETGITPLMEVASKFHPDSYPRLLDDVLTTAELVDLRIANNSKPQMARLLLTHGRDIDVNRAMPTGLNRELRGENRRSSIEERIRYEKGKTALMHAVYSGGGFPEIVKLLLERSELEINKVDSKGKPAFYKALIPFPIKTDAVRLANLAVIKLMLNSQHELDINYQIPRGVSGSESTALIAGAYARKWRALKLILTHERYRDVIEINLRHSLGGTVLTNVKHWEPKVCNHWFFPSVECNRLREVKLIIETMGGLDIWS